MSSLDKSLDDIISTSRKSIKSKRLNRGGNGKVGKKIGASNKKPIVSFKKSTPAAPKKSTAVDVSYATKVVVYGLPRDIKLDAIKVGGVQNIALSYNEKGQFKGIATIIFKSSKSASKAVEKYNGAPIDGGSSKLKLELIVDPTKKPLTSRIAPNKVTGPKVAGPKAANPKLAAAKAAAKANLKSKKAKPAQEKKPAKRSKKTVEQLDQEMADYFDN